MTLRDFFLKALDCFPNFILVLHSRSVEKKIQEQLSLFKSQKNQIYPVHVDLLDWDYVESFEKKIGSFHPSLILVIGGGSSIDLAKILKFKREWTCPLWAIPTTAGTGSEATPFATVYRGAIKESLSGTNLVPTEVFFAPELLLELPRVVRLSTAFDAFTHSMESIWSLKADQNSLKTSEKAARMILPFFSDPDLWRMQEIQQMQQGSYLAGQAIAHAQTTLAHALSYRLTGKEKWPHGFAVMALLPVVAKYSVIANPNELKSSISWSQWQSRLNLMMTVLNLKTHKEIPDYFKNLFLRWCPAELVSQLQQLQLERNYIEIWVEESSQKNSRADNHPCLLNKTKLINELKDYINDLT